MNEADRIKLAEAMGWTNIGRRSDADFKDLGLWGIVPGSHFSRGIPDPYTDANDCDALIQKLQELGRYINIDREADGSAYIISGYGEQYRDYVWEGDDYKQGVCELALKELDND